MSYDGFHPKADRIYLVQTYPRKWHTQNADSIEISSTTSYQLARYLIDNFPEFEEICSVYSLKKEKDVSILFVDSGFFKIFDLPKPPVGFFERGTIKPAFVSKDFKKTDYLQSELEYDIQGIIPQWPENTNIPFQVIAPLWANFSEEQLSPTIHGFISGGTFQSWVLLRKGVDLDKLHIKTNKILLKDGLIPESAFLTPIKKLHYSDPSKKLKTEIKFSHIIVFSLSGLLVILCALFNHITLYMSRMKMRLREFALRKVNGSSNSQITQMLSIEFLLVLFISLLIGFIFLSLCLPYFKVYADIASHYFHVYAEIWMYAFGITLLAFIMGLFPILHLRMRSLKETIQHQHTKNNKNLFRKVSLILQLTISIGLLFCSTIMLKQMNYLIHTDLGVNRRNVASVQAKCCSLIGSQYSDKLKQIPGIKDVLPVSKGFLRNFVSGTVTMQTKRVFKPDDGSTQAVKDVSASSYNEINTTNHFFDFFGIKLIEGENFANEYYGIERYTKPDGTRDFINSQNLKGSEKKDSEVVINEIFAKEFEGTAIGKTISGKIVVGVVKDFFITPTAKVQPTIIHYSNVLDGLAYRYEDGQRKQTQKAITQWMHQEFPDEGDFDVTFTYLEDVFADYFKSERALLALLSFMTGVCVLIALFGVFSLTSLTCEQRRKEIAIRKVNGAEVVDILNIFFKEYLALVGIAALLAFPTGYYIMKRWTESYVKQTSIDAWLFALIFLIVFLVLSLTIISLIWKEANRNPADVVKGE
jgi:ABC-type antimicrobial peptide transport system permease subunit